MLKEADNARQDATRLFDIEQQYIKFQQQLMGALDIEEDEIG
jgi:hypothetical protein